MTLKMTTMTTDNENDVKLKKEEEKSSIDNHRPLGILWWRWAIVAVNILAVAHELVKTETKFASQTKDRRISKFVSKPAKAF